jgi:uncharacterized protein YcbK (DUF882 family)
LLTGNPVSSYTKLSKTLLLHLNKIRKDYGLPIVINSSYRSAEYNLTVPGSSPTSNHIKGLALDLAVKEVEALYICIKHLQFEGEIGLYDWGIHIAPTGTLKEWDNRKKKSILNFISSDKKRNYSIMGCLALLLILILKR